MRIIICITIFMFSCSFTSKVSKKEDKIYWNKAVQLTWNDFKGRAKDFPRGRAAISYVGIDYAPVFTGYYDVIASFDRKASVKNERIINEHILKHEQYHFNIAELFVRRFRKRIRQEEINIKEDLLAEVFQTMQKNHKSYQDLYDKETAHSTIKNKQEEWEKKIDKELAELEEFASK